MPFPSAVDLPDPEIEPGSLALQADSLPSEPSGKPQVVKNLPALQEMYEMQVGSLGGEDPLKEIMATHSSILAWRIPGMGSLVGCRLWGCTESDTTEAT